MRRRLENEIDWRVYVVGLLQQYPPRRRMCGDANNIAIEGDNLLSHPLKAIIIKTLHFILSPAGPHILTEFLLGIYTQLFLCAITPPPFHQMDL